MSGSAKPRAGLPRLRWRGSTIHRKHGPAAWARHLLPVRRAVQDQPADWSRATDGKQTQGGTPVLNGLREEVMEETAVTMRTRTGHQDLLAQPLHQGTHPVEGQQQHRHHEHKADNHRPLDDGEMAGQVCQHGVQGIRHRGS